MTGGGNGCDFNPRLPGGRRQNLVTRGLVVHRGFNPRLPGGRRHGMWTMLMPASNFNPRLPGGRRPDWTTAGGTATAISIHASWVGGDKLGNSSLARKINFNPRLPGGRRLSFMVDSYNSSRFQSTPPGWEATTRDHFLQRYLHHFNPRLPGGRRRFATCPCKRAVYFNPRLPGGRRR